MAMLLSEGQRNNHHANSEYRVSDSWVWASEAKLEDIVNFSSISLIAIYLERGLYSTFL